MKFLNVACGLTFLQSPEWTNVDFSRQPGVQRVNLLDGIPFPSGQFDAVYCSHYVEHIQRSSVSDFLEECFRVLRPGGVFRLVTPDFLSMTKHYLDTYEECRLDNATLAKTFILDQCVRKSSGGLLGGIQEDRRRGELDPGLADQLESRQGRLEVTFRESSQATFDRAKHLLQRARVRLSLSLLPKPYRLMNVSTAAVGELHQWLYDFGELSLELSNVGFVNIERFSPATSNLGDAFLELDLDVDGQPRKGEESMFLEAIKPTYEVQWWTSSI